MPSSNVRENLNLNNGLNTNKYRLVFDEIKKVEILCTEINLPGLSANPIQVDNSQNKFFEIGNKLTFEQLNITFKIDEDLGTFKEIYYWMMAIYNPIKTKDFIDFQKKYNISRMITPYKTKFDATLYSLTNAYIPNMEIRFKNLFPINLSGINFSQEDTQINSTATFQCDYFTFS